MIGCLNPNLKDKILRIYMKTKKKLSGNKKHEPFYSDILELSKKNKITLVAARKELIRKAPKQK